MQQLDGLDALFALHERPHAPMHIAGLMVYAPETPRHKKFRQREVYQSFQQRLSLSPIFRRRLLRVPYALDHPYWVEDQSFELDRHIHSHDLANTSSLADLQATLAELHARPMDMKMPLWEVHIIHYMDRLPDYPKGSFGLYIKVHHAAMDGVSGTDILTALHGRNPRPFIAKTITDNWQPEAQPTTWAMARQACINNLHKPLKLAKQSINLFSTLRGNETVESSSHQPALSWQKSPFNQAINGRRDIQIVRLDFTRMRAMRRHYPRTTVNHIILSTVGGALRQYLIRQNALPETPLNALVPTNVRSRDNDSTGNAIGMLLSSLRTDIEDPLQRLLAVRDAAHNARKFSDGIGRSTISNLVRQLPSSIEAAALNTFSALSRWPGGLALPACTFVSNVPGAPIPLYFNDAKLVDMLGLGLIMDHVGLFHVAMSYNGIMTISVLSNPNTLSNPALYAECLKESFAALDTAISLDTT
jgi:diacylglycerol O-acyltransferase